MSQYTIYTSGDSGSPVLNAASSGSVIAVIDAINAGYGTKAASGWSKVFSGTNLAAYRAPSGVRHYLRIDNSSSAVVQPVQGYESMSDVNTGTHVIMTSGGKLLTGSVNPAKWVAAVDAVTFNLFIFDGVNYYTLIFGEFNSFVANDSFRTIMIAGNPAAVALSAANDGFDHLNTSIASAGNTPYSFVPRGHSGVGNAVNVSITGDSAKAGGGTALLGSIPYPNPSDGGVYLSPLWISDPTTAPANGVRGMLRGLWHWLHPIASVNDRDTISGVGALAGYTFMILKPGANSGLIVIETSNTLVTN